MKRIAADIIHTNTGIPLTNTCIIAKDDGTITDFVSQDEVDDFELFKGSIVPGFVNSHCHLELSHLNGKITPGNGLVEFVLEILSKRNADADDIQIAIDTADEEMYRNGIVCVGDISNGDDSLRRKLSSKIHYHTFVETFGFRETLAQQAFDNSKKIYDSFHSKNLSTSIVPHAPYSMSRGLLGLLADWYKRHQVVSSFHYLESISEIEFCRDRSGAFNRLLEFLGINAKDFAAYGEDGPAGALRFLNNVKQILLVHNTFAGENDFGVVNSILGDKAWFCTCPNANLYIENMLPDYDLWMKHTDKICIGTDSLASNHGLSIWNEIKTIHNAYNQIPFEKILQWSTLNGAKALDVNDSYGSIDVGKKPGLVWLEHGENESPFTVHQPVRIL